MARADVGTASALIAEGRRSSPFDVRWLDAWTGAAAMAGPALPALGDTLENDVMPVLASLDTVAPEVHQILEVAQHCLDAVQGIPGFQLLRRRGNENGKSGDGRSEIVRSGD